MGMGGSRRSQRSNTTSASGAKRRSATSTSHRGSRVEPSHITERKREAAQKKAGRTGKKK
ncbi:MAG: hypothetical protein KIT68_04620 [Phycisphaeraceae bacterium]|nr:hypothetical protein [Phycisphaeraceae bacterium]